MSNVLILIALSLGLIAPVPVRAADYLQGLFASCQKSQTDIYTRLVANSDKEIQQLMPMFTNLIQKVEIEEKALKNKSLCSKKNETDQLRLYAYLAKLETVKARIEAAVTEKATYSTLLKQMKDVPLDKFYMRVNGTVSNGNKPYLNLDEPKLKNEIKARIDETFKQQPKPPGLTEQVFAKTVNSVKDPILQNIQKTILTTVARKILPTRLFEQVALKFLVREAFSFSTIAGGLKSGGLDILVGFLQSSKVPDSGIVRDHLRRNPSAIIFPFLMDTRGQTAGSWLNYCQTETAFGFTLKSIADKVIAESEHNFNSLKASVEAAPQDFRKLAIQNANEKKDVAESTEVKIITQPQLLKTPVKK